MDKLLEKIQSLISPICEKHKVSLYSIEYKDKKLTILIDSKEGIDLDKCVEVSGDVSSKLDEVDLIKEEYTLEVASAGVERPLVSLDQFKSSIDQYILVHTSKLYEGYDELVGYLRKVSDTFISLEIKIKTRKLVIDIYLEDIIDSFTTVNI